MKNPQQRHLIKGMKKLAAVFRRLTGPGPDNRGASLVEALLSVAILAFVIVSILSGFSQQQQSTRNTTSKNIAISLAEQRIEELMKFPTSQLIEENYLDYVVPTPTKLVYHDEGVGDPKETGQFRRTTDIDIDLLGQTATITVTVDYPMTKGVYPSSVRLSTRRGLK